MNYISWPIANKNSNHGPSNSLKELLFLFSVKSHKQFKDSIIMVKDHEV